MKKSIILFLALAAGTSIIQSCHQDEKQGGCTDPLAANYDSNAEVSDGTCTYGGTGGNTTIVAKPQHHGVPIISKIVYVDSAFVKFNAINSPGTSASAYDLIIAGEVGEDHVHIPNMKTGKYYIFMTGFDSTIMQRVYGGIPYSLTQSTGEVDLAVPVSE